MGMFDDLVGQGNQGPKGLFGDLVPAQGEKPRTFTGEIVRQVGLTGRYAMEGVPQILDFVASPIKAGTDYVANKLRAPTMSELVTGKDMSAASPTLSEMGSQLADKLGLPKPETAQERVVADVTRTGFGAAGGAGAAGALSRVAVNPVAQKTLTSLAANPGAQVVSGAAAGGASGEVREAGGSPLGQAIAATAAAFMAPMAMAGAKSAANSVGDAVRSRVIPPQAVDARLKVELQRAGIDWAELSAQARAQIREDARKAIFSGESIDPAAMRRLADFRNIGATPLLGDITQNPSIQTQQRNLSKTQAARGITGANSLPEIQNANAGKVLSTLEGAATSPMDSYSTGQRIISNVAGEAAARKGVENAAYSSARAAAGREIPLDRTGFVDEAFGNLAKSNKGSFLPKEIETLLNQISAGEVTIGGKKFPAPFTVDTIDELKTVLGSASRATQDGNVKAAIKSVRDALENVQIAPVKADFGGAAVAGATDAARMRAADDLPAEALAAFDRARATARSNREWAESAPFIEDALGGATPDAFVRKHVINAPVENLQKLRTFIGGTAPAEGRELSTIASGKPGKLQGDPDLLNAVRKQMVDYVMQRGGADSDVVKYGSDGLKKGFDAIDRRKWEMFFTPQEIQQLKSAVNVARYTQAQTVGSAVNNSNTSAAVMGSLNKLLDVGKDIPVVGPMVAGPLQGITTRMEAIPLRNLSSGLVQQAAKPKPGNSLLPLAALLGAPALEENK